MSGTAMETDAREPAVGRRGVLTGLLGAGAVTGAGALTAFGGAAPAAADPGRDNRPFVAKDVMPVNVKDYGATGNGETDDTAAIQAAIDAAGQNGEVVYFPAGTYVLSGSLTSSQPLALVGAGMWRSIIRRSTDDLIVAVDGSVGLVDLDGLGFDGAGHVSNLFEFTAPIVDTVRVRACRFTRLRQGATINDYDFAAFQLRDIRDAEFVDSLFHNPAEHAGWGMALHVPEDAGAGRIIFTGSNRFLWLSHAMRIRSGDGGGKGEKDTSTELVQIDGGYFDHYWWLIPAGWSGEGGTVSYRDDGLNDAAADFSGVTSEPYPRGLVVRAMPVRHSGSVSSADARTISEDGADFSDIGLKRGEIIRSGNVFAVVEAKDRTSDNRIVVEQWLDNDSLLPAPAPAPGEAYTVFGVLVGKVAQHDATTLTFDRRAGTAARWHDLHGEYVTPADGTRYEVLQARPGYHVQCVTGVQNARVTNNTFRRAYFDQLSGGCRNYQVIGNTFIDGQDVGHSSANQGRHVVIGNDFTHQGARALHLNGDHDVVLGNRSRSVGWIHYGAGNAHYVMEGCRWGYAGHNVAEAGEESVRSDTPGILLRHPAASRPSDTCEGNTVEHNTFHGLTGPDVRIWSEGVFNNHIIGTANVEYAGAEHSQRIDGSGEGSPDGVVRAVPGSTYIRLGGEAGSRLYVKESGDGAEGWVAK